MIDKPQKEAGKYVNETFPLVHDEPEHDVMDKIRDAAWTAYVKGYRQAVREKYELCETDEYMLKWTLEFLRNEITISQHDCSQMADWLESLANRFGRVTKKETTK